MLLPTRRGALLIEDFLSPAEERRLLDWIDGPASGGAWKLRTFNGPALGKCWGVKTDLFLRTVRPGEAMPAVLVELNERMRAAAPELLAAFVANEANALDYRRSEGHHLGAHCDDRQLNGAILVNISLAGDSTMTYTHDKGRAPPVRVPLPRRSLQIQSGDVRYDWQHAIEQNDVPERRVSLTFRQSALTCTPP